ncbi:DUF4134 family protein [Runella sp. MFBS21]|uniref:DUF4134 family protein n=1 Tax=Runella sp. MFBS21 TaxID=3034018 RepID=UPI0023F89761|nr:DUF4134 family protein [Runella sp. MFBS21]MDF7821858.1 DUF4134 family protein [Runella sp. MFBS21]
MKKLFISILFIGVYSASFAQVYYDDSAGDTGIRSHITGPLTGYIPLFYKFSMAIIAIVAIVITAKIYVRWQEGDDSVFSSITRWYFGLIVVAALLYFLKLYFQDYELRYKPDLNF